MPVVTTREEDPHEEPTSGGRLKPFLLWFSPNGGYYIPHASATTNLAQANTGHARSWVSVHYERATENSNRQAKLFNVWLQGPRPQGPHPLLVFEMCEMSGNPPENGYTQARVSTQYE